MAAVNNITACSLKPAKKLTTLSISATDFHFHSLMVADVADVADVVDV